jgi:uncharacterized protein DUF1186/SEC-C motif-containing protein
MEASLEKLTDDELVAEWTRVGLDVPADLVTETVRRGEALVPLLGALLTDRARWASPDDDGWAPIHAIPLLSAIGSAAAAPFAAEFLRRDLGGDWTTEFGQQLVFSLGPRGLDPIWDLIADPNAYEWGRAVAIDGVSLIAMSDEASRPEIIERLRSEAKKLVDKPRDLFTAADMTVLTQLCDELGALHDEPSRDIVRRAFEDGRCDELFCDLEHVEANHRVPFADSLRIGRRDLLGHFDPTELDRLRENSEKSRRIQSISNVEDDLEFEPTESDLPIVAAPKPGRNEPCPCGSWKKYKRCCGRESGN